MSKEKVSERLEKILLETCKKHRLNEEKTRTIVALVSEIRASGSISSDHLVRVFDAIGGEIDD